MNWHWVIVGLIVLAVWTWRALFRPFADCGRCKGTGKKRSGRRFRRCWRCKGTGSRQVLGSRQVRRLVRGIRNRAWETKR